MRAARRQSSVDCSSAAIAARANKRRFVNLLQQLGTRLSERVLNVLEGSLKQRKIFTIKALHVFLDIALTKIFRISAHEATRELSVAISLESCSNRRIYNRVLRREIEDILPHTRMLDDMRIERQNFGNACNTPLHIFYATGFVLNAVGEKFDDFCRCRRPFGERCAATELRQLT